MIEAIASHRPYRPALGINVALDEIIKNRGRFYDPEVVDACLRLFREKGFQLNMLLACSLHNKILENIIA